MSFITDAQPVDSTTMSSREANFISKFRLKKCVRGGGLSLTGIASHRSDRLEGTPRPNVRGNLDAEAGAGWPRKDDLRQRQERPDVGCRSGSG